MNPDNFPHRIHGWEMDLYGNRQCTRASLAGAAQRILSTQLGQIRNVEPLTWFGKTHISSFFDLLGKHLHVSVSLDQSMFSKQASFAFQLFDGGLNIQIDGITGPTEFLVMPKNYFGEAGVPTIYTPDAAQANPVPPGDKISRGLSPPNPPDRTLKVKVPVAS